MLLKDELGEELAYTLDVNQLDDIDLVIELLRGLFVPLETLLAFNTPILHETTAVFLEEAEAHELRVRVEVFSTLSDCAHHGAFGTGLRASLTVEPVEVLGRGRVDAADQRILELESLVTAEYDL